MHVLGIGLMAAGVFGLLLYAAHIAWQEIRSLRYLNQLDEWAEDVEWQ